jgi:anti-anti-sigma factor
MDPSLSWHEHSIAEAALVVEVRGPLLFPESRVLGERLAVIVRGGVPQLVLDLSEVTELDAALVGLLLASARQLGWGGGRLTVVTQDPRTLSMLATTGLDATVEVTPTQTDALRRIAAVPSVGPVARVLVAS